MSAVAAMEKNRRAPEREERERGQFAELIRDRRRELGESLDRFAAKAVDPVTGTRVTRGWIYRLETGEAITPPVFEELRALAAAAELPVGRLQDAAGRQFHGVEPLESGTSEARAYVRKLDRLPPDQRERLMQLIDTLVPPGDDETSGPSPDQ
ncbi:helix-turn-helix domain-containing protein [Streptomyces sp. MJP52]|uniref:helix-turn-helix domain-containing protein n=1 Tax=Streptomyces sp. MJP52 TaxID=2940555 RepID=UPI002476FEE7|nr:helix-turn-helix domain-containing protein [Streptomyces sp. MJP52]MDH6226251.1 transcriptional regulator with XRE-family HTH domain [Streptomyces sp. MJP52]